jgi:hypothetical protein
MAGRHAEDEQESTYRWIAKLKWRARLLKGLVKALEILAHQARNRQIASSSVADEIEAILGLVRNAHTEMEGLHQRARALHRRIISRVEQPRKSKDVEARSGVKPALRDVG